MKCVAQFAAAVAVLSLTITALMVGAGHFLLGVNF